MSVFSQINTEVPGDVYLCQVGETICCAACCGLYNVTVVSHENLGEILPVRTETFSAVPRNPDVILKFKHKIEKDKDPQTDLQKNPAGSRTGLVFIWFDAYGSRNGGDFFSRSGKAFATFPEKGGKMSKIKVIRNPAQKQLDELGVNDWPIWTKESSEFPWTYDETETCFFLEGDVVVTPEGGEPVKVGKGDLVTFPTGMSCTWKIRKDVKKHYRFG
jgi:uncharacterized cupin superfamily protein